MSRYPGTTYLPLPSTSFAAPAAFTGAATMRWIFPASTSRVMPGFRVPSRVSTTVTLRITVPLFTASVVPSVPAQDASMPKHSVEPANCLVIISLALV